MNYRRNLALLSTTALLCWAAPSLADVRINGQSFPDNCKQVVKIIDGTQYWGVKCPQGQLNQRIEQAKRADPPSFGGFASQGVAPQPANQPPIRCQAAESHMMMKLSQAMLWFRQVIYGPNSSRVLTSQVAFSVRDRLRSWAKGVAQRGFSIYRHRRLGEDADSLCAAHIDKGVAELNRVMTLVRLEASKGNRDLKGTGLNPKESPYNN